MFDFFGSTLSRGLGGSDVAAELADEKPVNPFPHGPQRFKPTTQGQWRRRLARRAAAQNRKTNRRFRRDWMKNERAFTTLQQQVKIGFAPEGEFPADLVRNVKRRLVEVYGSADLAVGHLSALELERKRAA